MTYKTIISEFCSHNGIAYDPNNGGGAIELRIGNGTVLIIPDSANGELNVLTAIGKPPAEGAGVLNRQMLEENFRLATSEGAFLSFDSESGNYVVSETIVAEGLNIDTLQRVVTDIAKLRDTWRGKLLENPQNDMTGSDVSWLSNEIIRM